MRVFLAGAGGAIGRPLLPRLIAAGHEVTGLSRSEERAAQIRTAGAEALVCDVFDAEALARGVAAASPEVVVHEMTSLPDRIDLRKPDYGPNNRIRREGTETSSPRPGRRGRVGSSPRASPSSMRRPGAGSRTSRPR